MKFTIHIVRQRQSFNEGKYSVNEAEVRLDGKIYAATVVGDLRAAAGMAWFQVEGEYVEHDRFGQQLKVSAVLQEVNEDGEAPKTLKDAFLLYLRSGKVDNIGPVLANRLLDMLGQEAALVALNEGDVSALQQVDGIGELRARSLVTAWARDSTARTALFGLAELGIPAAAAAALVQHFGAERAAPAVKESPWVLLKIAWSRQAEADEDDWDPTAWHHTLTWELCDQIAVLLHVDPLHEGRLNVALQSVLRESLRDGHTAMLLDTVVVSAARLLMDSRSMPVPYAGATEALFEYTTMSSTDVTIHRNGSIPDALYCSLSYLYSAETAIYWAARGRRFERVMRAEQAVRASQETTGFQLDEFQIEACETPFQGHRITLITGGPGTGKTTLVRTIVHAAEGLGREVILLAPTGKAAKRLGSVCDREASTVHRFLAATSGRPPLTDNHLVIVDETSMLDVQIGGALCRLARNTPMVLVGDIDQLPSVGPGRMLTDLIEHGVGDGVHCTRLERVYRQGEGSGIVAVAREIRDGDWAGRADGYADLSVQTVATHTLLNEVMEAVEDTADALGVSPREIPVLCPQYKGDLGIHALNESLRRRFGQESGGYEVFKNAQWSLCIGDPVIWKKNAPDLGIVNGDQGNLIDSLSDGTVLVDFDGIGIVSIASSAVKHLRPRYAMSVHACVSLRTWIDTPEEMIRIRDLPAEGEVLAPHGNFTAYRNKVIRPVEDVLCIQTRGGYEWEVTPDHGVDVWDPLQGQYVRKEGKDVQLGDFLRLRPGPTKAEEERPLVQLPAWHPEKQLDVRAIEWSLPTEVTPDLARWLGLMVADGTVFKRGFRLVKRHTDVPLDFSHLCEKLFGVRTLPCKAKGATAQQASSTHLAAWITALFPELLPRQKDVPRVILRSPLHVQAQFLRGLFEDGGVSLRRQQGEDVIDHIEWANKSPEVVRTVRHLLLRQGIRCGCTANRRVPNLYIYGAHTHIFRDRIGFTASAKMDRLYLPTGEQLKYLVPVGKEEARCLPLGVQDKNNARRRGHLSVKNAMVALPGTPGAEKLDYFHEQVTSITKGRMETSCVSVPDGHRFLQNGFSGWNSQGSEYPGIILVATHAAGRALQNQLLYTALTRAQRRAVLLQEAGAFRKAVANRSAYARSTCLPGLFLDGPQSLARASTPKGEEGDQLELLH